MRLCIISNSHATSLKDGLSADPALAEALDCTFFAAPKDRLKFIEFDEYRQALVPPDDRTREYFKMTSGGLGYLPVDAFDAFFIYGLFFTLPRLKRFMSARKRRKEIDDSLQGSLAHRMAECLSAVSTTPIIITPEPWRAETPGKRTIRKRTMRFLQAMSYAPAEEVYAAVAARELPDGASYLWQDPATFSRRLRTRSEFGVGSRRLMLDQSHEAHTVEDQRHMNGIYGAIVLRRVAETLGALPPGP